MLKKIHNLCSSNEKRSYYNSKKGKERKHTISYSLQIIDSVTFMASSLSNLINNLAEEFHKIKCKYGHDKNMKHA